MADKTIKVLNQSTTRFRIFKTKDPKQGLFLPNTTLDLAELHAKKLMAMFPKDIIAVDSLAANIPAGELPKEEPSVESASTAQTDTETSDTEASNEEVAKESVAKSNKKKK